MERKHITETCPYCGKEMTSTPEGITIHKKYCKKNPNREVFKSHKNSEETRKKISEAMKKAHKDGRAGTFPTRKNCQHSYPENWMIGLLKREFNMVEGIDYLTELSFNGQFLDFAWPESKLCIEVDGDQHQRFEDRKANDLRKDRLLKENGWKEVRVSWSYIYNNSEKFVNELKEFFNSNGGIEKISNNSKKYITEKLQKELKKKEEFEKLGKIDRNGNINYMKLSSNEIEERANLILNCGVDLNKFGWIAKASKITGLSCHQIQKIVNITNINCYRRQ